MDSVVGVVILVVVDMVEVVTVGTVIGQHAGMAIDGLEVDLLEVDLLDGEDGGGGIHFGMIQMKSILIIIIPNMDIRRHILSNNLCSNFCVL